MGLPLGKVLRIAGGELSPSFVETVSLVSAAYVGSLTADVADFYLALTLIFIPTIFLIGYLLFRLRSRGKLRRRPSRAIGFEDWLLGVTTGFLFGSIYSLEKLALGGPGHPGIPSIWILISILLPTLFIVTMISVLAKRTVKTALGEVGTVQSVTYSFPPRATSSRKAFGRVLAVVLIGVLTITVYIYRNSINLALGSTIASEVLLVILIFVDAVGGVAVPLFTRRADKRSQELLGHYNDLKYVFRDWGLQGCQAQLSSSCIFRGMALPDAQAALYLTTMLSRLASNSHTRAIRHLNARRYQGLESVMSRIYQLEDDHNIAVSTLVVEIMEAVRQAMRKFPTLSEWRTGTRSDFYQPGNIISAIEQLANIEQRGDSTNLFWGGNVFADAIDAGVRNSLSNEVSQLVESFRSKVTDLREDSGRMEDLFGEMRGQVAQVVDQIETYHSLDGQCDFENTLG